MMEYWSNILEQSEGLIRSGKSPEAVRLLENLNTKQIPKKLRLQFANHCRRTGLVEMGLRILTPVVRPSESGPKMVAPTPNEMAEYAVLLQRYGAAREALQILETLTPQDVPEVNLFKAYCHFNLWQYEKAVPCLRNFVNAIPESYLGFVGQVNLAAALIETYQFEEAEQLTLENIAMARKQGYTRLLGNSCEMLAKIYLLQKKFNEAEKYLQEAGTVFATAKTHDQLYVKGLEAWLEAEKSQSTLPLKKFREEAFRRGEPESAREADLNSLAIHFVDSDFQYLYFGTPFESFRSSIVRRLGRHPDQESYILGAEKTPRLEITSGHVYDVDGSTQSAQFQSIPRGQKVHMLTEILLRDFYRPMNVGELFAALFANEYFDIFTSLHRIEQVVYRARIFLNESKLPLAIVCSEGKFSLQIKGGLSIQVPRDRKSADRSSLYVAAMRATFSEDDSMSTMQIGKTLGLTRSACQRFISRAIEDGVLDKFGAGPNTKYFFTKKSA